MPIKLKFSRFFRLPKRRNPEYYKSVLYSEFIAKLFKIVNNGELEKASRHIVNIYMDKHDNNYEAAKNDLFNDLKNSAIEAAFVQRFSGVFSNDTASRN